MNDETKQEKLTDGEIRAMDPIDPLLDLALDDLLLEHERAMVNFHRNMELALCDLRRMQREWKKANNPPH